MKPKKKKTKREEISIDNINEIIDALPNVLNYLVPGYIFITIYDFIMFKSYSFHTSKVFPSIICSYVIRILSKIIANILLPNMSDTLFFALTIILGVGSALLITFILNRKSVKKFMIKTTNRTINTNIWRDMLGDDSWYRLHLENEDYMIEGQIRYYEENAHTPYIELQAYRILDKNEDIIKNYIDYVEDNDLGSEKERTLIIEMTKVKYVEKLFMSEVNKNNKKLKNNKKTSATFIKEKKVHKLNFPKDAPKTIPAIKSPSKTTTE